MKRLIISIVMMVCAASVSAQTYSADWLNSATNADNWAVGLRVGPGLQVDAEYSFHSRNSIEGRFGMSWCNGGGSLMAELTALYNWHIATMDWTPNAGEWFFDAGCGVVIGGRSHYAYFGFAGAAKFGIKFRDVPLRLAIDWTPYIGPGIAYGVKVPIIEGVHDANDPSIVIPTITGYRKSTSSSFNEYGFANFGISCVYYF